MTDPDVWETHALWWQQTFTQGVDEEYEHQILPLIGEHLVGCERVLDLGTGEGQVARVAARTAPFVVGVDRSQGQVLVAQERGAGETAGGGQRGPVFARADVTQLPFAASSFDAVTACLVFEHVDDLGAACAEVARALVAGGRFLLFLNHPAFQTPDSGWIDDHILDEQYWRSGPYLREQTTIEQVDAAVAIPFAHRPLSTYVNTMAQLGLFITAMSEPAPPVTPEYPEASTIPRLLFLCLQKR